MSELKQRILELAAYVAPSGAEGELREQLLSLVSDVADETWVDALGNGIARKRGDGPHVMLAAHADEVGVMVIHIEDEGFLRIISVGPVDAKSLVGRHVQFTNGVTGVIHAEHKVKLEEIGFEHLYIDIAANNRDEAAERAPIGLSGVILEPVVELTPHHLAGRALDNRVGCAVAIEAFRQAAAAGKNVSVVFTAQQTVGARGARPAAFQLRPDLALVVDAAPAGDMPGAKRMDLKLGHGPAIKVMDGTSIIPLDVKRHLEDSAERVGVAVQYEVWPRGLSDAGALQMALDGVPTGGVTYPARYVGGPTNVIDLRDAEAAVKLLVEAIVSR
jgi:putative aminopeptidase FrvX